MQEQSVEEWTSGQSLLEILLDEFASVDLSQKPMDELQTYCDLFDHCLELRSSWSPRSFIRVVEQSIRHNSVRNL